MSLKSFLSKDFEQIHNLLQHVLMLVVSKTELDIYTKKTIVSMIGCIGLELAEAVRMEQVVAKKRLVFLEEFESL